jgi:hypothetical protein
VTTEVKRITGIITNQLDSGTSFALCDDTDEQVFIRSVIAKRVALEVGDEVEMVVVPNANDGGSCPWFALRVIVLDDDYDDGDESDGSGGEKPWQPFGNGSSEPVRHEDVFVSLSEDGKLIPHKLNSKQPEPQRKWAEEAYMFLHVNGPATTSQIAKAIGYSVANIRTYLCKMHDRGEIVRADIRTSGGQSKASATVWALELHDLLPEENDL